MFLRKETAYSYYSSANLLQHCYWRDIWGKKLCQIQRSALLYKYRLLGQYFVRLPVTMESANVTQSPFRIQIGHCI